MTGRPDIRVLDNSKGHARESSDSDALERWADRPEMRTALLERDPQVLDHAVRARPATTWRRHVTHPAALSILDEYDGALVTRRDMACHAAEALHAGSASSWVQAYMVCQLWGVGTTGRMGWTAKTLDDRHAPAAFAALAAEVQGGEPQRAAGRWAPGWNVSFTTKFAYAVALAIDIRRPTALIYEDRIRRRLAEIEWKPPASGTGRRPWRRYEGFLESVRSQAARLACRPDTIEWVLFDTPVGQSA